MPDTTTSSVLPSLLKQHESELLKSWLATQLRDLGSGHSKVGSEVLREQSKTFLSALQQSAHGSMQDIQGGAWEAARDVLTDISTEQARAGATPVETATFVFSLKEPIFELLNKQLPDNPKLVANEIWAITTLLDKLGLFTTSVAMKKREEIIERQQEEMLELSTPVVKLWDGVLALPLIGTLDSERTQVVMESLLQEIVRTGAGIAIIDITGVATVDTLVAQHLLKTVAAARLMGAECVISGIRPQIAATIVHLGVDLGDVTTKATLADAFRIALERSQLQVVPRRSSPLNGDTARKASAG